LEGASELQYTFYWHDGAYEQEDNVAVRDAAFVTPSSSTFSRNRGEFFSDSVLHNSNVRLHTAASSTQRQLLGNELANGKLRVDARREIPEGVRLAPESRCARFAERSVMDVNKSDRRPNPSEIKVFVSVKHVGRVSCGEKRQA
jgi:hypothetical protein